MKPINRQSTEELRYNLDDATAALSAMPGGHNARRYLDELHTCRDELCRRETLAARRRILRRACDPLTLTPGARRQNAAYLRATAAAARSAAFCIGWNRVHPLPAPHWPAFGHDWR